MPEILVLILVQTGLPGVALTLNIGQLVRMPRFLQEGYCIFIFTLLPFSTYS